MAYIDYNHDRRIDSVQITIFHRLGKLESLCSGRWWGGGVMSWWFSRVVWSWGDGVDGMVVGWGLWWVEVGGFEIEAVVVTVAVRLWLILPMFQVVVVVVVMVVVLVMGTNH